MVTGGAVDVLRGASWPDGLAGLVLGVLEHAVVAGEPGGRLADRVRPGAVRAVAGRHRAADVDHHDVPAAENTVGDLVVRAGGVRPGADDHEVHLGVPLAQDGLGYLRADLAFGYAGPEPAGDLVVDPVDRLPRLAERLDLSVRLAHPQARQDGAGEVLFCLGKDLAEPEDVQGPHPVREAD
jgi:hypothetical protein